MNPYASYLVARDPLEALADTPQRIGEVVASFTPADFARSYAPGKWTARQILVHLAQTELMFGARLRHALLAPDYAILPFDQNDLLALEPDVDGPTALSCYRALRAFTLPLVARLDPEALDRAVQHPERGRVTVRWIVELLAGHDLHHFGQIRQMAAGAGG